VSRTPELPPGIDFTDPDIHAQRTPVEEVAELTQAAPIWWNEPPPTIGGFDDEGYWVIVKHAGISQVSRRSDVFSSHESGTIPRLKLGSARQYVEMGRLALINCARSCPAASRRGSSKRWRTSSANAPRASREPLGPQALVTSSSKCPLSCPCKRSPVYSEYAARS
jgi:hypothetical protein